MRIDLGLILAIFIEYILFIYYADTLFYRKKNKYVCYGIIAIGYLIHFVTCAMGNLSVNIIVTAGMYILFFLLCYHIQIKTAIFQSALLMIFLMIDECLVIAIPYIGITFVALSYSPQQSFMLTIISRLLYIIEIMCVSRLFCRKHLEYESLSLILVLIPGLSFVIVYMLMGAESLIMITVCTLLVIINIIAFMIDQKIFRKELETVSLKEQLKKEEMDYEEYKLLVERYEQTKVFRHDLKEHLSVLDSLLDVSVAKAKEYIGELYKQEAQAQYVKFSNNKMLNILLSKKMAECTSLGIKFVIDPIQVDVDFINNMDIVTIFSNLINNAVESSVISKTKQIFLSITVKNNNFVVVKMENTCDTKPIVINSRLKTIKKDQTLHGIGMSSIKRCIKNYDGELTWGYDEDGKLFNTTVIINSLAVRA